MKVIHAEPTPDQFIRELHAWIAVYPDGTQGIMAHGFEGIGMTPLISSNRDNAEALEPLAQQIQRAATDQGQPIVSVRLVTFTSTEG